MRIDFDYTNFEMTYTNKFNVLYQNHGLLYKKKREKSHIYVVGK